MSAPLVEVFSTLRAMFERRAEGCVVKEDTAESFIVVGPRPLPGGRENWLGGVQLKKRYVSVHLMGVYTDPTLLEGRSEALRKRMQGKSCFNFTKLDPATLEELDALTVDALARSLTAAE